MMTDLRTQLREYTDHIVERVELDDMLDDASTIPVPTRGRSWRGWLVGVAAAAVVLVFGLVLVLVSRQAETTPPATDPAPTVPTPTVVEEVEPVPSPTTVPAPTAIVPLAAGSVTWTQHEGSVPPGDGYSYDETPVGLVAVRRVDFQVPVILTSGNGFDWTEVPIPARANVPILPEENHSDAFDVELTAAGVWLSRSGGGLWFADLESWVSGDPFWEEMPSGADLLELKGPPPVGTRWVSGISHKARIADTSLFAVEWELQIDYGAILDLPPGYTDINHDDLDSCYSGGTPGQLSVRGTDSSGAEVCLTSVTVVDGADGVSVLNESGDQVAFIENAVAEFDYGSGGPHFFPPSNMLDLYAATGGQVDLVRSIDGTYPCSHNLDQGDGVVVHVIECDDVAMTTTDGETWEEVPQYEPASFLGGSHPLGFSWESTWPWGPPDDQLGPAAILISDDGETWTELLRDYGYVFEAPSGLVITQTDEKGDLADEIVFYNGESLTTVQADWPVGEWPEFLGAVGNTLILIHGTDVWVGEVLNN